MSLKTETKKRNFTSIFFFKKQSFFTKIFLSLIVMSIFSIVTYYIFNIFFLEKFYVSRKEKRILEIAEVIKSNYKDKQFMAEYTEYLLQKEGIIYKIIPKTSGKTKFKVVSSKSQNELQRYDDYLRLFEKDGTIKFIVYTDTLDNGVEFEITTSLSVMNIYKNDMFIFNILVSLISIFISLIIARIMARKFSDNIKKVNNIAKNISELKFDKEITVKSGDEIEELSSSIYKMGENLETVIESLKNFSSNASHELKTPLAVVNNYSQALLSSSLDDKKEIRKYGKIILDSSEEMLTLINNLLIISRLSNLNITLNKNEFDIRELINNSIEKFEDLALSKDIDWNIDIGEYKVLADKNILKVAIDNIVSNALKYSLPSTKIFIAENENEISIKNQIKENLKIDTKLFEPFTRGNNILNIEGSGLGLSIIKKIFDLHQIKYKIEIQEEKNEFYFLFLINKK